MSIRTERVSEQLLSFLATELRGLKDPRAEFLTLTEVSLSKDLKKAHVFWSKLPRVGAAKTTETEDKHEIGFLKISEIKEVSEMLNKRSSFLKKRIAQVLKLRFTPSLVFSYDDSLERANRLENLLADVRTKE